MYYMQPNCNVITALCLVHHPVCSAQTHRRYHCSVLSLGHGSELLGLREAANLAGRDDPPQHVREDFGAGLGQEALRLGRQLGLHLAHGREQGVGPERVVAAGA